MRYYVFFIQISNPKYLDDTKTESSTIAEFLEEIVPLQTESCIMAWNGSYIPLSYKYDISIIFDDIVFIVKEILRSEAGVINIDWPSNTFFARWNISWHDEMVEITAKWINIAGDIEHILNKKNKIKMNKIDFLAEWRGLIVKVHEMLCASGRHFFDLKCLELEFIIKSIGKNGVLY